MTHQNHITDSQEVVSSTEFSYAGLWRRSAACIIDLMLLFIIFGIVMGIANLLSIPELSFLSFVFLLFRLLIGLLYFPIMESSNFQASVGKLILGLKVTDENGNSITFLRALGRNAVKMGIFAGLPFAVLLLGSYALGHSNQVLAVFLISLFGVLLAGVLITAFSRRKQCLHDFATGTLVVRDCTTS